MAKRTLKERAEHHPRWNDSGANVTAARVSDLLHGPGAEEFELAERATALAGMLLTGLTNRPANCRPPTWHRYRRLVDEVREAIDEDVRLHLRELAELAGVSAYDLSRTFRLVTGLTVSRYRLRLRLQHAIERLFAGDDDLARIAVDVGFSDQAHFTRALRDETGLTPGVLRSRLARDLAQQWSSPP